MSKREDRLLLADMIEAGKRILDYTAGYDYNAFVADRRTMDACIRNFEIIGEAANLLSGETTERYSAIPWRKMKNYRNILIHHYFGVNDEVVWDIISNELPATITQLEVIHSERN